MEKVEFVEILKIRTKKFALEVIKLTAGLPNKPSATIISKQLLSAATSVGGNYRAATHARSKAEFYSKISIVIEEADECLYWFKLLDESELLSK